MKLIKLITNLILKIKNWENDYISRTSFVTILLSFENRLSSIIGLLLLLLFEDMLPSSSLYNAWFIDSNLSIFVILFNVWLLSTRLVYLE
jgi:hypothetical protein